MKKEGIIVCSRKRFTDEQISQTVYIIRIIAIIAVIAAHVNVIDKSGLISNIITHFWAIIARFGVPAFLITGGYYYYREKNDSIQYWKKRIKTIIFPWIIASIVTYLVSVIFGSRSVSIMGYIKWFIGSGTFYYYMTIYIIILAVFKFINKTHWLVVMILVTLVSLIIEQANLYGDYGHSFMTSYLNPLNWIGFFAFGIIVRKYHLEQKVDFKVTVISLSVCIMFSGMECFFDELSYFSIFNPITQTTFLTFLFGIFVHCPLNSKIKKIMFFIGSNTLIVYLYHIQIVQLLNRLYNSWIVYLIKPVLGTTIMFTLIYIGYILLKNIPYGNSVMKYIGLKEIKR